MMQLEKELTYCKRCGTTFNCNANNINACQCNSVSISTQTITFISTTTYTCLCANCLKQIDDLVTSNVNRLSPNINDLIEGKHYYKENGFFVFTELYHFLKGSCCGNSCRHCAYGNSKSKENVLI